MDHACPQSVARSENGAISTSSGHAAGFSTRLPGGGRGSRRRSRTVLHLVSSFGISGVNTNLKIVACKMKARGWLPVLYQYGRRNKEGVLYAEDAFAINQIPKLPRALKRFEPAWIVFCLRQILRRIRPKLIHAHSFDADLIALRAAAGLDIPVVITCQSFSYLDWAKEYFDHYRRWKDGLGCVVCVTHEMADRLERTAVFSGIPHEVIFNVPAERFFSESSADERASFRTKFGVTSDEVLILCTATFHPIKGHIVLADAFSRLPHRNRSAKMILLGDTCGRPDYLEVKQQVEKALQGVVHQGRVQIIQGCLDPEPALRAADVYVQPSFMEALSVATAEAMATGLPVVASKVGGLKEMVADGVTGLQVEPGHPQQLASALQRLIDDPLSRQRMGAAAREFAQTHFSPDVAAARYEAVYDRVSACE